MLNLILDKGIAPSRILRLRGQHMDIDHGFERYRLACRCRKPGPGMIEQACREMNLDPARSFTVGDRWLDVACGNAAGTRTVRVRTGHGVRDEEEDASPAAKPNMILNNLMEAAGWILRNSLR